MNNVSKNFSKYFHSTKLNIRLAYLTSANKLSECKSFNNCHMFLIKHKNRPIIKIILFVFVYSTHINIKVHIA